MAEIDRPYADDVIEQSFSGADVEIVVVHVPEFQPYEERGVFRIIDQYDEVHLVERDGETWVTTTEERLEEPSGPRM